MRRRAGSAWGWGLCPGVQRTRLLEATFAVVAEQGYRGMTVRRVCDRAGVSNKTFYDLFSDREDCFLAAFEQAVDELAGLCCPRMRVRGSGPRASVRGSGRCWCLDREPALRRLVFVEALGAGPRVLRVARECCE